MPIYEAPGRSVVTADGLKADRPKTVVCTLEATDSGDTCYWCGYASGSGHGKRR